MAKVIEVNGQHCVAHSRTGQVLVRKGEPVCFTTRPQANAEAKATQYRVLGGDHCPTS